MSKCAADGCERDAVDGKETCGTLECAVRVGLELFGPDIGATERTHVRIGSKQGDGAYDAFGEAIMRDTEASAVFVLVMDGKDGGDYSLHIDAPDAFGAELWARRTVSHLRRLTGRLDISMDAAFTAAQKREAEQDDDELDDDEQDDAEGKH